MNELRQNEQEQLAISLSEELAVVLTKMLTLDGHGENAMSSAMQARSDSKQLYTKLAAISFGFGPNVEHSIAHYHLRHTPDSGIDIDGALSILLLNEVIISYPMNGTQGREDWPEEARHGTGLSVICNDTFAWATADCEAIRYDQIKGLFEYWEKDSVHGAQIWCIIDEREMPISKVVNRIKAAGIWDLDALQKEHKLRPNLCEAFAIIRNTLMYEKYSSWATSRGIDPILYSSPQWWEGWRDFTQENKDWSDEEWKRVIKERQDAWIKENWQ